MMICKNCGVKTSTNHSGLCFRCRHIKNLELREITDCGCPYCKGEK